MGNGKFTVASFLAFICSFRLHTIIDYHQFELHLTNLLNDLTYD